MRIRWAIEKLIQLTRFSKLFAMPTFWTNNNSI